LETFVPGRELTVSMLGDEVLPIIEIEPKEGYYDYSNKYTKGKTEYHCPAELSDELNEYIANLAYAAFKVLGCEGFGRVDFRLSPDNIPFCLEVNTLPGFTTTSLLPMAAKEIDLTFEDLCQQLVDSI
jgi:D-alanine-D-alanine ligase